MHKAAVDSVKGYERERMRRFRPLRDSLIPRCVVIFVLFVFFRASLGSSRTKTRSARKGGVSEPRRRGAKAAEKETR